MELVRAALESVTSADQGERGGAVSLSSISINEAPLACARSLPFLLRFEHGRSSIRCSC